MTTNWTIGAVTAIAVGVGAALADSLGPAGYAVAAAAALLAFRVVPRGPRRSTPRR